MLCGKLAYLLREKENKGIGSEKERSEESMVRCSVDRIWENQMSEITEMRINTTHTRGKNIKHNINKNNRNNNYTEEHFIIYIYRLE